MRRTLLLISLIWAMIFLMALQVEAYELLIIQSQRSSVYNEVLRGVHSVKNFSERVVILSEYSEIDVKRIVREESPRVVVTLGDLALEAARKVTQVPVVPLMAASYRQSSDGQVNMNGIDAIIPSDRYMALFKQLKLHRVGIVFDKAKTGNYVRNAQRAAAKFGITLVVREVTSPKEVFAQLDSLRGSVDALWMLPDATVVSQVTVNGGFAKFSIEQNVPLVSFSGAFLAHGAAIVVEIDRYDLGRQAGEMIVDMLDGTTSTTAVAPRKAVLQINQAILKRLGISPEQVNKIQRIWE